MRMFYDEGVLWECFMRRVFYEVFYEEGVL